MKTQRAFPKLHLAIIVISIIVGAAILLTCLNLLNYNPEAKKMSIDTFSKTQNKNYRINILITSGAADPNWQLTSKQNTELEQLLSHLQPVAMTSAEIERSLYQGLGYRGFYIFLSNK